MNNSKNYMKKIALMLVIASLSVTCFGCSDKNNDSSEDTPRETISLDQTKQPLTFVHDVESEADATESKEDAKEEDATTANDSSDADGTAKSSTAATPDKTVPVTEYVEVTDASGQPVTDDAGNKQTEVVNVTEKVDVTDASGQPVTDNAGNTQTEVVNVTEAPTTNENPATEATQVTEAIVYTPSYDVCKAYWLDMSQECDFFFNGEFLVIEFEVNEDIPDGNYPITFKKTDIASWDVVKWDPVCINGEVAVNRDITAQEDASSSDFTLKINSVAAKQGETAKVTVDLSNNPGFCGFVIEVEYDKSALKIKSTSSGADFDSAINYVTN